MTENPDSARGGRLRRVRFAFGKRGERTSIASFARELGVDRKAAWTWENEGRAPRRGLAELAERLARVAGIKRQSLDAQRIALWVWLGEGEMPAGAPPPGGPQIARTSDKPLASVRAIIHDIKSGALDEEVAERALLELFTARRRPCAGGRVASAFGGAFRIINLDDTGRLGILTKSTVSHARDVVGDTAA